MNLHHESEMNVADFTVLETSQILDQSFRIYRNHFLRMVTIAAVVLVPFQLTQFFISNVSKQEFSILFFASTFLATLLSIVGQQLMNTTLVAAVSNHYLGRPVTLSDSFKTALPILHKAILAAIGSGIIILFGLLLLIIPGLIFSLWFFLISPIIVVENAGPIEAMARSRSLVIGYMRKVFYVFLFLLIIGFIASWGGMILVNVTVGTPTVQSDPLIQFVNLLVMTISGILIAPLSAIASILLYYDLRIRKEGYDLEMLANQLAATDEAAQPAVAVSE